MNEASPAPARRAGALPLIRRFLPLLVLLVAIALVFLLGLDQYLSFEALRQHRSQLLDERALHAGIRLARSPSRS